MYDTLGPEAVVYILDQTQVTTVSCTANYVKMFFELKNEGKSSNLQNLIVWDEVSADNKSLAEKAGLKIYSFQEV